MKFFDDAAKLEVAIQKRQNTGNQGPMLAVVALGLVAGPALAVAIL